MAHLEMKRWRQPSSTLRRRLVGLSCLALIMMGCRDGIPVVMESRVQTSPDGKWEATIERVENGMGFGLGAVYDEVHVSRPGVQEFVHGDQDPSCVFYIESAYLDGDQPRVRWADARQLVIEHPNINKPGRARARFEDVAISYEPFSFRASTPTNK